MAEWVRALALHWRPDGAGQVRITLRKTSLWNFGNSVYPALPVSFGGGTKSRRSLLSGVYARGKSKIPPVRTGMCNCRGLHNPL